MNGNRLNITTTGALNKASSSFDCAKLAINNGGTDSTVYNGLDRIISYNGTRLIGNTGVTINGDGQFLNVRQPFFLAVPTSTLNNVTGNDVTYNVALSSIIIDNDNNFSTSTNKFTAPANGHYKFTASILRLNAGTSTRGIAQIHFIRPSLGNTFLICEKEINSSIPNDTYNINGMMYMHTNDTAQLQITVAGGTQNINLQGNVFTLSTFFGGYLVS